MAHGDRDGRRVLLVRHAMPLASPQEHPERWPLSPDGIARAERLRNRIPPDARLVASDEVKAIETLRWASGQEPRVDPRFGEVRRPGEPFDDSVRDRRRAWVEGRIDERHARWENPDDAAERFDQGLRGDTSDGPLVVATHGMILTAWLIRSDRLPPGDAAGEFWAGLGLPDVVEVLLR